MAIRGRDLNMGREGLYSISENFLVRKEFFGGIVHSRLNGERYEISDSVALLLSAINHGLNLTDASNVACQVSGESHEKTDIDNLIKNKIITSTPNRNQPNNDTSNLIETVRSKLLMELQESKKRNYLRAPINISLFPTMKCQLSCEFCFVTDEKWDIKEIQSIHSWGGLIEEAKECGVPFISILGGEPTLYPGLVALIRKAEQEKIKTTFTSNGLQCPGEVIEALENSEWVTPVISIQSLDLFNKSTMGVAPSKALSTLAKLRKRDINCRVNAVYSGQSERELVELIHLCEALGVEKLSLGHYLNLKNPLNSPSFTQSRKIYEYLSSVTASLKIEFQLEGCLIYSAYPEINATPSGIYEQLLFGCEAGNGRCEVMANGTLLPCSALRVENWGGLDVFKCGLQYSWDNSNTLKKIRNGKTNDSTCASCKFGGFCNGGCPAVNEIVHGVAFGQGDERCNMKNNGDRKISFRHID